MSNLVPYEPSPLGSPRPVAGGYSAPEGYPDIRTEGMGFSDYIAVLRRQLWIVLASVAVFVGVATWMVMRAPPRYTAGAVIRLADARRAVGAVSDVDDGRAQ